MSQSTIAQILQFAEYDCNATEIAAYLGVPYPDVRHVIAQWWGRAA